MTSTIAHERSEAWSSLRECLDRLQEGPWRFVRLRGGAIGDEAIDGDDVDLLGSRESVDALLEAAFGWVGAGHCHLRVRNTGRNKVGLAFISPDGKHRVDLDLWIDLWQIDGRRRRLTYQDCRPVVLDPENALQHLPLAVEASVFVHHLVSRGKKISSPKQLARLASYAERCREAGEEPLAAALESIAGSFRVSSDAAALTLGVLEETLGIGRPAAASRLVRRLRATLRTAWFSPPKGLRMLTIMGCDGCGKTTLSKELSTRRADIRGVFTGKHLYRKSLIYKFLVIFLRPLLFQGREKFDDIIAPVTYVLACLKIRLKLLVRREGVLLIDRSIMDFLMVERKTDAPRFSRLVWLSSVMGARLPHIHFMVPFERLKERKLEMTETGHAIYDAAIFRHFSRRVPTDYVAFDNRAAPEASAEALGRIIDWIRESS